MSRLLRYALGLALTATVLAPTPASAAYPTAQVTPGQSFSFPSSVEFDWSVSDAEPGTIVTVIYTGCGHQVAGYAMRTSKGDYYFTISADPGKLGSDWTRTLTVEQEGSDTYTETVTNTDEMLQFECSDEQAPIVDRWSRTTGEVTKNPRPGDRLKVSATRLSSWNAAKEAVVTYVWTVGAKVVGRTRSLKVRRAWARKPVSLRITAATPKDVWKQTKRLKFGTVRR